MALEARISRLEATYGGSGPLPPASVPADWAAFDDDGQLAGPPLDEPVTGRQQRTIGELAALDASVPIF